MSHNASAIVCSVSNTFASRRSANRRRRNEAREQILEVARRELKAKPFRDLSVDELMQATGLSRTAFYRYFPDREAVLVDLLEEVWGALAEARDVETAGDDRVSASSMAGLAQLLADNRGVLKAIADSAPGDEDVERAYRSFMYSYWIDDLTARVVEAQRLGMAGGLDPELTGEALGWMAERMVTQSLDRDPSEVLDTIIGIIARTLFSGRPADDPVSQSDVGSLAGESETGGTRTETPTAEAATTGTRTGTATAEAATTGTGTETEDDSDRAGAGVEARFGRGTETGETAGRGMEAGETAGRGTETGETVTSPTGTGETLAPRPPPRRRTPTKRGGSASAPPPD